jgi:hypothetical protein
MVSSLESLGYTIWYDSGIGIDEPFWEKIIDEIKSCDIVFVMFSPGYVTSEFCLAEYEYARALKKVVCPFFIEYVAQNKLPPDMGNINLFDISKADESSRVITLVKAINQSTGKWPDDPSTNVETLRPPFPKGLDEDLNLSIERLIKEGGSQEEQDRVVSKLKMYALRDDVFRKRKNAIGALDRLYGEGYNKLSWHTLLDIIAIRSVSEVSNEGGFKVISRIRDENISDDRMFTLLESLKTNPSAEAFMYSVIVHDLIENMRNAVGKDGAAAQMNMIYGKLLNIITRLKPGDSQ